MAQELISIIIPAHNIQDYLEDCVQSVLCQTYQHLEILLVDDGSTDGTASICDALKSMDSRIHVIHKPNGGLSDARNTGISMAKGSWLFFLDGDDCLFPEAIELLYHAATEMSASIAIGNYLPFWGELPNPVQTSTPIQILSGSQAAGRIYSEEYYINFTTAWAKLFRKDHFHYQFPKHRYHEDEFVTYRILYEQTSVVYVPVPVYAYRKRPGSIMQTFSPNNLDILDALEEQCLFWKQHCETDYLCKASCRYLTKIMSCAYKCRCLLKSSSLQKQLILRFRSAYSAFRPYLSDAKSSTRLMLQLFYYMPFVCMTILFLAIKTHLFPPI